MYIYNLYNILTDVFDGRPIPDRVVSDRKSQSTNDRPNCIQSGPSSSPVASQIPEQVLKWLVVCTCLLMSVKDLRHSVGTLEFCNIIECHVVIVTARSVRSLPAGPGPAVHICKTGI